MNDQTHQLTRLIPASTVEEATGLTYKTLTRMEARSEFPKRVAISPRQTAYVLSEVQSWIRDRIANREREVGARHSPNPLSEKNRQKLARS